ncbi:hypothetical protein [Caryophanon latum]|uniref:Uncharacterized protein n=1 Tax=Caryophanon latum TaxID=33977 RepID=A0A1C0YJC7_9BACL|nr:hypothetical protein [Caryophanon latum]OCS87270.1 hypothetical protein A6K76_02560 [Caryophanon latum]
MISAAVKESSYYIVENVQVEEFRQLNEELRDIEAYVDFCSTIRRPECQLFFDFYIFLANDNVFVNHERSLNVPIYAYLNEVMSRNKYLQQFKKQYMHSKKTCMITSMYLNKTLEQLIGDVLVAFKFSMEHIIEAVQSLDANEPPTESALDVQKRVLTELKERFLHDDYFNTFVKEAVNNGKWQALNILGE